MARPSSLAMSTGSTWSPSASGAARSRKAPLTRAAITVLAAGCPPSTCSAPPAVVSASTTDSRPARVMCSCWRDTAVSLGQMSGTGAGPPRLIRCYRSPQAMAHQLLAGLGEVTVDLRVRTEVIERAGQNRRGYCSGPGAVLVRSAVVVPLAAGKGPNDQPGHEQKCSQTHARLPLDEASMRRPHNHSGLAEPNATVFPDFWNFQAAPRLSGIGAGCARPQRRAGPGSGPRRAR